MADKKISQLTALSAANVASATDVLAIVDTSATETKKITAKDLIDGALNGGTANGVLYLNGSKVATSGSALTFDGTIFRSTQLNIGTAPNANSRPWALNGFGYISGASGNGIEMFNSSTSAYGYWTFESDNRFSFNAFGGHSWTVGGAERMRIDSGGSIKMGGSAAGGTVLGISDGTTDATSYGSVQVTKAADHDNKWHYACVQAGQEIAGMGFQDNVNQMFVVGRGGDPGSTNCIRFAGSDTSMRFLTSGNERARITSGGDFVVGLTSASARLQAAVGAAGSGTLSQLMVGYLGGSENYYDANTHIFRNGSATERARITSGGDFLVRKTASGLSNVGFEVKQVDANTPVIQMTTPGYWTAAFNRQTDDGDIVLFFQADTQEGSISVSGNTVSYNAFAGSHWSQLQDGSKPDILRGTVMESINELCEWPGEQNERLPKAKISDTAGSKKVYGVFMAWDNDWTETNDMYVTAVGAFICRVNGSITVQEGDLLESNGDGTARVQSDDIIRSSTIGKVTSTVKTHQYDDGSYCVPTVLYCG